MSDQVNSKTIERAIEALTGNGIGGIKRSEGLEIFDSGILWHAELAAKADGLELRFFVAASSEREARLKLAIEYPEYRILAVSPQTDIVEAFRHNKR